MSCFQKSHRCPVYWVSLVHHFLLCLIESLISCCFAHHATKCYIVHKMTKLPKDAFLRTYSNHKETGMMDVIWDKSLRRRLTLWLAFMGRKMQALGLSQHWSRISSITLSSDDAIWIYLKLYVVIFLKQFKIRFQTYYYYSCPKFRNIRGKL